jgi:hypothetical protein
MKTAGLIDVRMSTDPSHPPGSLIWTSYTGRDYLSTPEAAHPDPDALLHVDDTDASASGSSDPDTLRREAARVADEWRTDPHIAGQQHPPGPPAAPKRPDVPEDPPF